MNHNRAEWVKIYLAAWCLGYGIGMIWNASRAWGGELTLDEAKAKIAALEARLAQAKGAQEARVAALMRERPGAEVEVKEVPARKCRGASCRSVVKIDLAAEGDGAIVTLTWREFAYWDRGSRTWKVAAAGRAIRPGEDFCE